VTGGLFFSASDILGLRRPKNVKFGIKMASSMRMMHTLSFWKRFFNRGKTCTDLNMLITLFCRPENSRLHTLKSAAKL